jgi:hypothetical protein
MGLESACKLPTEELFYQAAEKKVVKNSLFPAKANSNNPSVFEIIVASDAKSGAIFVYS